MNTHRAVSLQSICAAAGEASGEKRITVNTEPVLPKDTSIALLPLQRTVRR